MANVHSPDTLLLRYLGRQLPDAAVSCLLLASVSSRRRTTSPHMCSLLQQTGMAGIVLKYSTAATAYFPAANKAVVPPAWFNYLPAGYLPGLAVQVCSHIGVNTSSLSTALQNCPSSYDCGAVSLTHVCPLSSAVGVISMASDRHYYSDSLLFCRPSCRTTARTRCPYRGTHGRPPSPPRRA